MLRTTCLVYAFFLILNCFITTNIAKAEFEQPRPQIDSFQVILNSEPGDYIGEGQTRLYQERDFEILFEVVPGRIPGTLSTLAVLLTDKRNDREPLTLVFGASNGNHLAVGKRAAHHVPPGLDIWIGGRHCQRTFGNFTISKLNLDSPKKINSLAISFKQRCDSEKAPALSGELVFSRSSVRSVAPASATVEEQHDPMELQAEIGTRKDMKIKTISGVRAVVRTGGSKNRSKLTYNLSVSRAASYFVWYKAKSDHSDRSFYVSLANRKIKNRLDRLSEFTWRRVSEGNNDVGFSLSAGSQSLVLSSFDKNIYLDSLIITSDPAFVPEGRYSLSVDVPGSAEISPATAEIPGTVQKRPNKALYQTNEKVKLEAKPSSGYAFDEWSGDASGNKKSITIRMNANKVIQAKFLKVQTFSLTTNAENGSVSRSPNKTGYKLRETVKLTPHAAQGFRFMGWSGDASGTANPLRVVMDADKTITALFSPRTETGRYSLSIQAVNGSVTKDPDQTSYNGQDVKLTAVSNPGYEFERWSGDLSGTANPKSVEMDRNRSLTAHFRPTFALSVSGSNGTISRSPDKPRYSSGEVVRLTAAANSDYQFDRWSGAITGSVNPVDVTMDCDKAIVAHFVVISGPDITKPIVSISSHANNAVISGSVTITANASDNVGVAGVQFKLGDQNLGNEDTFHPYSVTFNSSTVADGSYELRAVARDASGNSEISAPVQIAVSNAGGSVLPSAILDLSNWEVQLPSGENGNIDQVEQPELAAYSHNPYFMTVTAPGGQAVQFRAPVNGKHTSGSQYARSELREMKNNGADEAGWSTSSGVHTMIIDQAITALPKKKRHIIAGQIHGDSSRWLIFVRLEGSKLYIKRNNVAGPTLDDDYQLGERFKLKFEAKDGHIYVYYNDLTTPVYDWQTSESGCYFKAGAYVQANCNDEDDCSTDNYGEVRIYDVQVSHCTDDAPCYTLSTDAQNGAVTRTPAKAQYSAGENVQLNAVPAAGYLFTGWSGDATGTANPLTVTMSANKSIIALFAPSIPDVTAPTVEITAPQEGATILGSITLSAAATDDTGEVAVQFKLDGTNIGNEDLSAPYEISWNSAGAANGPHTLTAVARDSSGKQGTFTINVTINNPPSANKFTFAVYGDIHKGLEDHRKVLGKLMTKDPDFIINVGDMADADNEKAELDTMVPDIRSITGRENLTGFYFPVQSNHGWDDGDGTGSMDSRWDFFGYEPLRNSEPGDPYNPIVDPDDATFYNNYYYSFIYKNALFVVLKLSDDTRLQTEFKGPDGSAICDTKKPNTMAPVAVPANLTALDSSNANAQYKWLYRVLDEASRNPQIQFKFVFAHYAPWSAPGDKHSITYEFAYSCHIRKNLMPILEHFRVDAMFSGHDHAYERTYPIAHNSATNGTSAARDDVNGVTYIVTGKAGGGHNPQEDDTNWEGLSATTFSRDDEEGPIHHGVIVEIDGSQATLTAVRPDLVDKGDDEDSDEDDIVTPRSNLDSFTLTAR